MPLLPSVIETTDAAATTGTAYTLQVGQSAQGTLTAGDHDYYRVYLTAGTTYTVSMVGTGSSNVQDTLLRVLNDTLSVVATSNNDLQGQNSQSTFTVASSGYYYIDAAAASSFDSGQYGISITQGARASFDDRMGAGVIDTDLSWGRGAEVTMPSARPRASMVRRRSLARQPTRWPLSSVPSNTGRICVASGSRG